MNSVIFKHQDYCTKAFDKWNTRNYDIHTDYWSV